MRGVKMNPYFKLHHELTVMESENAQPIIQSTIR